MPVNTSVGSNDNVNKNIKMTINQHKQTQKDHQQRDNINKMDLH